MNDSTMNTIGFQQLDCVTGGTEEQCKELRAFIKKHDPSYKIYNYFDIMHWIDRKSGIKFDSLSLCNTFYPNEFRLAGGRSISQAELMEMLSERFPD